MGQVHRMKLKDSPFNKIKNKSKTIELRLFDDKRRKVNPGDNIIFTNLSTEEQMAVAVKALYVYASFKDMFEDIDPIKCGNSEDCTVEKLCQGMREYYSEEDERVYGVVGFGIELSDLDAALALEEKIAEAEYDRLFPDGMK